MTVVVFWNAFRFVGTCEGAFEIEIYAVISEKPVEYVPSGARNVAWDPKETTTSAIITQSGFDMMMPACFASTYMGAYKGQTPT